MTQAAPPPQRRLPRLAVKIAGFLLGSALGLAGSWCVGFLYFVASVPDRVADAASHTDAIVVLTGGSERVATGLALLDGDLSQKLFISGVHPGVDSDDILKSANAARPELAGALVLGYGADDTVGNAAETAAWARAHQVRSVRLVTGAYHMPRSLLEFRHAMPEAVLIPHPVFPETVKSREWWRWPGTAALLATEYSKYLAAEIRHWFLPRPS